MIDDQWICESNLSWESKYEHVPGPRPDQRKMLSSTRRSNIRFANIVMESFTVRKRASPIGINELFILKQVRKPPVRDDAAAMLCSNVQKEFQITTQLQHANILQLVDVFEHSDPKSGVGFVSFIYEHFDDCTLITRLAKLQHRGEWVSLHDAHRILSQITAALAHAHSLSIVHRALSLESILVAASASFDCKLTHFGFGKVLTDDRASLTGCPGKEWLRAPEAFYNTHYDTSVDMYV